MPQTTYRSPTFAERGEELEALAWGVHAEMLTTDGKIRSTLAGHQGWLVRGRSLSGILKSLDADLGRYNNVRRNMSLYLKASGNVVNTSNDRAHPVYWLADTYRGDAEKLRLAFTSPGRLAAAEADAEPAAAPPPISPAAFVDVVAAQGNGRADMSDPVAAVRAIVAQNQELAEENLALRARLRAVAAALEG